MATEAALHILHLARWYPYREDPMFGLFVQQHVQTLVPGHRCTVVFVWPLRGSKGIRREVTTACGFTEVALTYPLRRFAPWNWLLFTWLTFREMSRAHRRHPVSLVHVHVLTRLAFFAWLFGTWHRVPYVVTEHWARYLRPDAMPGTLHLRATRFVLARAGWLTQVSEYLRKGMEQLRLEAKNVSIVGNVVRFDLFAPQPAAEPSYFVHVSTFDNRAKNITGMIEAFALLRDRGTPQRLLLVGDGQDMGLCRALVQELELGLWVSFTGMLTGQALADAMARATGYIQFSNYENMPVVISEALACGVPVISTRVGGIAEVITAENGLLLAPRDVHALAEAVAQVAQNAHRYHKEQIREAARALYSHDAVRDAFTHIYRQVLASHPKKR